MIFFIATEGALWPATVGPLVVADGRVSIGIEPVCVVADGLSVTTSVPGGGDLFVGSDADCQAVFKAILDLVAVNPHGIVECRVREGSDGVNEALAWMRRAQGTTLVTVKVAPPEGGKA